MTTSRIWNLPWTVERGLLVCAQNVLDIATHIAASAAVDAPDIDALGQLGVVPRTLAARIRPLAGLRDVLVHAYLTVDSKRVHGVLQQNLPELHELAKQLERFVDERSPR